MNTSRIIRGTISALAIASVLSLASAFGDTIEAKAKATIIPKLECKDLTPADALKKISTETGIKVFYTPATTDKAKIKVSLTNIPAEEAFKYVTGLANLKFAYEKDGVRVIPQSAVYPTPK